jgi:hypothetical protein
MSHDPKTEAQSKLVAACEAVGVFPGHVYSHWNAGGEYVVFAVTLDEATLEPLVHYYSLTRWTRTLVVFVEPMMINIPHARRFERVRPATLEEFLAAIDVRLTVAPDGPGVPTLGWRQQ